jgi:hypothetical protein
MNFANPLIARAARAIRLFVSLSVVAVLAACAHPMSIEAKNVPTRANGAVASDKKVAYVMSDVDRAKQVTTDGGGGDKVSYFPYRDFERSLRAALAATYADVSVVRTASDSAAIKETGAAFVFVPEILTSSSSPSLLTWPPTRFSLTLSVDVLDSAGIPQAKLRVTGNGAAEWEEFKGDFALAGRRAVEAAAQALITEVGRAEKLR